ncbi:MAG: protocatechuate 3,4-dioxygenase subunit beta [Intrasporangium sp.]|uniref:protocatechuate 3,4-dioxygenase subunit beta n=1 Tax=Intrasporangium sp. TaxID=1925024 RepID=UPI00264A3496|nr:protocatechuate 3,4-dioxygenase subunit beta [Intrasporangium sp.]MDN5796209.1 protocatechuate 3,4-dioxygenase subunit beta [Intrasporangium sp.]
MSEVVMEEHEGRQCAPEPQQQITAEIEDLHRQDERAGLHRTQSRLDFAPYRSSVLRHPTKAPAHADPEGVELFSPVFGTRDVDPLEADLTIQRGGEPIGERIRISGRILDGDGHPVRGQLVEIWQANAAGRYIHKRDQHPAPIDPHFTGAGRTITGEDGGYAFLTIKPGPYPWGNHRNAWRPAHVHFSLFGREFTQRMITQMYFPGDPLFALDPIYQSVTDPQARDRLVATYHHDLSEHEYLLGYHWDIVLTGAHATRMELEGDHA